jgi:FAD/FMN-containing dehydrogenase
MNMRTKDLELVRGAPLDTSDLTGLSATFRGELIGPSDEEYDSARRVWNAMVDHRPALIARCLGAADVASAIGFARDHELEVSVRGGGHSIVGHAVADDSLVVDLSRMRGVQVDPRRRRARVQGGAWIADLDRETQHFGLATTGGVVMDTGVGGLTLGGGYGWLARRFGLACDNLRGVEIVTADGSIQTADDEEHPDLFWAVRGGGGNFGVVTAFDFDLHPFGPAIATGDVFYRFEDGAPALDAFRDLLERAPDELYLLATVSVATNETPVPAEHRGKPVVGLTWVWVGDDPADGKRAAASLGRAATPIASYVNQMTYVALQTGAFLQRRRLRAYWKSSLVDDLSDEVLQRFLHTAAEVNDGRRLASGEMLSMGGAIARIGDDETAYGHRSAAIDFLAVSGWEDPAEDRDHVAAARAYWQAVADVVPSGVYVNNLGDEGQDRVREAYGAEKYDRLAEIKGRYDPENVFCHNQNILPANAKPGKT